MMKNTVAKTALALVLVAFGFGAIVPAAEAITLSASPTKVSVVDAKVEPAHYKKKKYRNNRYGYRHRHSRPFVYLGSPYA